MSTPAPAAETDSKKKSVGQAAVLGIFVLGAIVIAAVTFFKPVAGPSPQPTEPLPAATNRAEPGDLTSQAAQLLASMKPEVETGRGDSRIPVPGQGSMAELPESEYQHLLQALGTMGQPTAGAPTPGPESGQLAQRDTRDEARLAPLAGVIAPNETSEGSGAGGQGRAGQGSTRLRAGTVLEAALAQTLSSDYPGTPFIATLTRDAFLADGSLALPKGSTVLGTTAADDGPNAILQGRLTLNAQKIVRPDGEEIELEARALDAAGIGAIPGKTNRHALAQVGGVLAYALIGAASTIAASDEPISASSTLESNAVQGAGQQLTPLANRYLSVMPTVVPPAGTPIRIVLSDGLAVTPYRKG